MKEPSKPPYRAFTLFILLGIVVATFNFSVDINAERDGDWFVSVLTYMFLYYILFLSISWTLVFISYKLALSVHKRLEK